MILLLFLFYSILSRPFFILIHPEVVGFENSHSNYLSSLAPVISHTVYFTNLQLYISATTFSDSVPKMEKKNLHISQKIGTISCPSTITNPSIPSRNPFDLTFLATCSILLTKHSKHHSLLEPGSSPLVDKHASFLRILNSDVIAL